MPPTITFAASMPADTDLIATGVREDHLAEDTADVDSRLLEAQGFVGRLDQTALVSNGGEQVGLLVGLGPAAAIDPAALRRAGAAAGSGVRPSCEGGDDPARVDPGRAWPTAGAEALAEGVVLGAYRYGRFKDADPAVDRLVEVTIVGRGGQRVRDATARVSASPRRSRWPVTWSTRRAERSPLRCSPSRPPRSHAPPDCRSR